MKEPVFFYKFAVDSQVFFRLSHTYALVNLKPLVPGHVLVVPLRTSVLRFGDLSAVEGSDYMNSLQIVQALITRVYKADSLNIAIQDGPESGQSVPHLHTHIIPRFRNDKHDDSIHKRLEELDLASAYDEFFVRKVNFQQSPGFLSTPEEDRYPRSEADMAKEATSLRGELRKFIAEEYPREEEKIEPA